MNSDFLKRSARCIGVALLMMLSACESGAVDNIPPQKWQGMDVHIETRPSPPRPGMDEILVIVTDESGRPGYDLVVSLRSSDQEGWVQAIEDGQVGVYRRAVEFAPGAQSVLQVQIRRGDTESVLYFPLKLRS